jgi:phytoene dehydrogenase-like protein
MGNKVRLNAKSVRDLGELDVIIIGSGMSALTTGSLMSQSGFKVCVLEKHDQAGGCLHTFEDKGYEFDTGVHYIGAEVGRKNSQVRKIFDTVTGGFVTWDKLDDCYDEAICGDEKFKFYADYKKTKAELKTHFPDDTAAIDAYYRALFFTFLVTGPWIMCKFLPYRWMRVIFGKVLNFPMKWYCGGTAKEFLQRLTKNEKLIGVLTYLYGDAGAPPGELAWTMQALLASHWEGGAFYPHGGPSAIAMSACEVIRKNGGQVLVAADVTRLLFDDNEDMGYAADVTKKRSGRCWGVEVNGHQIYAEKIVSCAGARNTFMKLLPERYQGQFSNLVPKMRHFDGMAVGVGNKTDVTTIDEEGDEVVVEDPNAIGPSMADVDGTFDLDDIEDVAQEKESLLAETNKKKMQKKIESIPSHVPGSLKKTNMGPSCSMVTLFVGLNCDLKELDFPKLNKWIFPTWDHDENMRKFKKNKEAPFPAVFIGSGSIKDNSWNERWPLRSTLEVLAPVEYHWFAEWQKSRVKNRGGEYKKFKDYWTNRLLAVLYEQYPQLKGKVSFKDLGTPLSNNYYLGVERGEVYGLTHTPERILDHTADLSPFTDIQGLYLGGQDIITAGVVGALMSGVATVAALSKPCIIENATMLI